MELSNRSGVDMGPRVKNYVKERSRKNSVRPEHAGQDALLFYKFTSD